MANVRFTPQAWINDYACEVDPEGPVRFLVPDEDTSGMVENDHTSDHLKNHANAPEWIKDWSGPFEINFERDEEEEKS